ncbi:MAG: bifunctional indole-3-glycerol-phosphate synthase TrpC/phosphoribosylanthranilate isomerase TrpF [Proteobacteria bacterium]|nr:bifunctional indole-3-glycerol-phosphate synthase TrpC/phosphoribosylanthranilate isomerase TrpF [Pseudomonadota bacterium]
MALDKIVAHKRGEVNERKARTPLEKVRRGLEPSNRSFYDALRRPGTGFIFECKKASPSRGLIREDFDPVQIAESYAPFADAISVLVDNRFFQGRLEYMQAVRKNVEQPVLAKDFILEPYQIYEARRFGADAVLLMFSVLDDATLADCAAVARSLGIDVLAEVHDGEELDRALELDLPIIGINNRNLKTLKVDLKVVERLATRVPADRVVVAESGISSHGDVLRLRTLADAFLIGSSPMSAPNIEVACKKIVYGRVKVCGLTRPEDARAAHGVGATYGGLIFAKESHRYVNVAKARAVCAAADLAWVGVFVDEPVDRVRKLAEDLDLAAVQLHGDETREYVADLRNGLKPGCEIWKACRVKDQVPTVDATGADRLLLDAFKPGMRGGTGHRFDWSMLKGRSLDNIILSGGLNTENAVEADANQAFALDVNSGVEESPGIKSEKLLSRFFAALRGPGRSSR